MAPDVVTGGVVAEAGPPPDFSLWTVEDDILLKNAIEVCECLSLERTNMCILKL